MTHLFDDKLVIPALKGQMGLFLDEEMPTLNDPEMEAKGVYFDAPVVELDTYDNIVVCMSGGKDSIACLLHILEMGADRSKIELWHHEVDGREGSSLMDWPFMTSYNKAIAKAFDLPIYFSWLQGGFEKEMLKENAISQPHWVETPDGLIVLERDAKRSKPSTRLKFPQVGANLQTRWCSSALKIDVGRRALNNQDRFNHHKTLFITGERREESSNRAKYNQLEPHACSRPNGKLKRIVDAWRPVLHWSEEQVWDIMNRHGVLAPVPYRLGWSRSSCRTCIFNSPSVWATIEHYFPDAISPIAAYEQQFGTTISRDRIAIKDITSTVEHMIITDLTALEQARSTEYTLPIFATEEHKWTLPEGAFKQTGGPS